MFRLLLLGNGWADCVEICYALGNPLVTAYAVVTGGVSLHVRTCAPRFGISGTARPIMIKFGVWVWSYYLSALHKSLVGYPCTCTRAHPISVSQETIDRLCLNLMLGLRSNIDKVCKSRRWSDCTYARASPVSLSRKPLSPVPEVASKTGLGEVGATPKLLSLDIKKMGKRTPGIISVGVFWKPGQLSLKTHQTISRNFLSSGRRS